MDWRASWHFVLSSSLRDKPKWRLLEVNTFLERAVYDQNSGQLVTASLMDYAVPRANEVPAIAFEICDVRCRHNPLGMKGAGEAGAIGSCPAVMNAIIDAFWRAFRISHLDMPATPERVWNAIQDIGRVRAL
jgi:carbon-monoxide dehydrogenase large subunit